MTNLAELEKVLGELVVQRYNFLNGPTIREQSPNSDVLLFPRKKLKMQRIKSGNWEPRGWFIESRLGEKSTRLEVPTSISHEGLTSGFRGAIILDDYGRYVKLKGVSKKTNLIPRIYGSKEAKSENEKGLCSLGEAVEEQSVSFILRISAFPFITIKPEFVEAHFSLNPGNLDEVINQFGNVPSFFSISRRHFRTEKDYLVNLINKTSNVNKSTLNSGRYNHRYISGSRINADTRLDEAVWNLTRKELTEEQEKTRDEILKYLFFKAGITKAYLTIAGFSWSTDLENTNNHLGNFVVSPKKTVEIGMCDFLGVRYRDSFDSYKQFLDYTQQELESFKEDLFDKVTSSSTVPLTYRHFPEKLRADCFNALKALFFYFTISLKETYFQ